jgi:hypothetical protein
VWWGKNKKNYIAAGAKWANEGETTETTGVRLWGYILIQDIFF